MSFRIDPFDPKGGGNLARNDPVSLGICDLRVMREKAAIRCFGGFAKPDCFIAVSYDYRENLEEDGCFNEAVHAARREWERLFPSHNPVVSKKVEDYGAYFVDR